MTETEDKLAQQHLSRMAEVFLTDANKESVLVTVTGLLQKSGLRRKIAHIIRDYCSQNLRPEIVRFAGLMEMKLLKHDPVRGQSWKSCDKDYLLQRIKAVADELHVAVYNGEKIGIKAADLANLAMMLADQAGELEKV
jgi:hypothetical protein